MYGPENGKRKQYPNGIRPGGLAIGDPGNLQCRQVFHAAMKKFRQSKQEARAEILQKAINACLSKAEEAGYESITFPAIGAGHRGYPPGLVAKTMLDCMANYVKRQTNTSIRNIVILTGFEAGGKVEQAFEKEKFSRTVMLLEAHKESRLIRDPDWLCCSYLHITTHTRMQMEQVVKELLRRQ